MTTALLRQLQLSVAFEHAKRGLPKSQHRQLESRVMAFSISRWKQERFLEQHPGWQPSPAVPFDCSILTTHQQAALLSLRETVAARACARRLLEDSQDRYTGSDFRVLRDHGLAEFKDGYRLHQATDRGRIAAHDLQKQLCKSFGIHIRSSGSDSSSTNSYTCSCGGWIGSVTRNIHASHTAEVSFSKHLREVRSREAISIIRTALKPRERA